MSLCERQERRPAAGPAGSGAVRPIVYFQNLITRRRIMLARHKALVSGFLFLLLLTSACGAAPAATQAPPAPTYYEPAEEFESTEAPAATEAPADFFGVEEPFPNSNPTTSQAGAPPSGREPY